MPKEAQSESKALLIMTRDMRVLSIDEGLYLNPARVYTNLLVSLRKGTSVHEYKSKAHQVHNSVMYFLQVNEPVLAANALKLWDLRLDTKPSVEIYNKRERHFQLMTNEAEQMRDEATSQGEYWYIALLMRSLQRVKAMLFATDDDKGLIKNQRQRAVLRGVIRWIANRLPKPIEPAAVLEVAKRLEALVVLQNQEKALRQRYIALKCAHIRWKHLMSKVAYLLV